MSALPPKADIDHHERQVRFVPTPDMSKPPTDAKDHADTSGNSCCQRVIRPAIAAPRMGASQNSQTNDCVCAPKQALPPENLQKVTAVTEFVVGSGRVNFAGEKGTRS